MTFNGNGNGANVSASKNDYIRSSIKSPCPVCNRTKDQDCSLHKDGKTAHCKTYSNGIGHDESRWHYTGVNKHGFQGIFVLKEEQKDFAKSPRAKGTVGYYYSNRDGSPLVRINRVDRGDGKKDFYQSHWDGSEWINGNPNEVKVIIPIYRYAEIQKAINRGELIFVVEGEATADALWKLGIAATTTIGGSGGYANYGNYTNDLAGARLVLAPDRDNLGIKYMSNFDRNFHNRVEGWYLAGSGGRWVSPQGGMDVGDDIIDYQYNKEQILAKVITPQDYQQISTWAETSFSKGVEAADNVSAPYQQLSADQIKHEVATIFEQNLSPLDREAEMVALASKLRVTKQSVEKIYDELERSVSASADNAEIEKILSAQRQTLSPHQVLPESVANKIEQIARARGTNPEPLVLGLLVACSSVPHANTRLLVGNHGDILSIYPNLFGMAVGDSGSLKSPTINTTFTKPLRKLQDTYIVEHEEKVKQYKKAKKDWDQGGKEGNEPIEPRLNVIVAGDVTIEKLEDLALYQPQVCPALYRDELIGLFQAFDKHGGKGGGDARSKLLSFYDGAPINSHRMGAGSKISKHDFHPAVFGGIQPEVLKGLAQQIGMDHDGTLCRFLYAPIDRTYKPWDTNPDTERIDSDAFRRLVDRIHHLPALECHMDASAQITWAKIANRYNKECLCNPNLSPWLKHSYSKAIGQLGKLSLTLHLIECASADKVTAIISSATITRAAIALDYFISQAISLIATTQDTLESHLIRVLDKAKKLGSITSRQVQPLFSGKKRIDSTTAKNYLQQLVNGGYGSLDQKGAFTPKIISILSTQPETSSSKGVEGADNLSALLSADSADNTPKAAPSASADNTGTQSAPNQQSVNANYGDADISTFIPFDSKTAPSASADNADKVLITYQQPEPSGNNVLSHSADNADKNDRSISSKISNPLVELKIDDCVSNLKSQVGIITELRIHTTPNGTKVPQAMVDFGAKKKWTDLDVLKLHRQT